MVIHYRIGDLCDYYLNNIGGVPEKILASATYRLMNHPFVSTSFYDLVLDQKEKWTASLKLDLQKELERLKTKLTVLALVIALGVAAYFSLFTVGENELVIVTQFGKPARVIDELGLHLKLPGLLESINRFDKRSDLFETQPTQLLLVTKSPFALAH